MVGTCWSGVEKAYSDAYGCKGTSAVSLRYCWDEVALAGQKSGRPVVCLLNNMAIRDSSERMPINYVILTNV
jgi:hypothetical protein